MSSTNFAYLSNYAIYSAMVLFTVAFIAHAVEVAFSVRNLDDKTKFDFTRTKRSGDLGTVMMVLAFLFLLLPLFSVEFQPTEFHGAICMNSR